MAAVSVKHYTNSAQDEFVLLNIVCLLRKILDISYKLFPTTNAFISRKFIHESNIKNVLDFVIFRFCIKYYNDMIFANF